MTVRTYWAWETTATWQRARHCGTHGGGEGRGISCRHAHSLSCKYFVHRMQQTCVCNHLSVLIRFVSLRLLTEMWYNVFLWALFSSFLVHFVASAIAFCRLRSHKIGRFIPVAIMAMGIIWPITGGAITST